MRMHKYSMGMEKAAMREEDRSNCNKGMLSHIFTELVFIIFFIQAAFPTIGAAAVRSCMNRCYLDTHPFEDTLKNLNAMRTGEISSESVVKTAIDCTFSSFFWWMCFS
jgi:hypothetical protein